MEMGMLLLCQAIGGVFRLIQSGVELGLVFFLLWLSSVHHRLQVPLAEDCLSEAWSIRRFFSMVLLHAQLSAILCAYGLEGGLPTLLTSHIHP